VVSFYWILGAVGTALVVGQARCQELAAHDVAEVLARMAASEHPSLKARVDGSTIFLGKHQLVITPIVEHSGEREGTWAAGVRFEIALDGRSAPSLVQGAVGTDTTRAGALESAVVIYVANFGVGLLSALADSAPGYHVDGYKAFPGFALERGSRPSERIASPQADVRILAALAPTIRSYAGDSVTALSFWVATHGTSPIVGECWLGGRPIGSALPALYALAWPKNAQSYYYKASYVLVRQR